MASEHGPHSEQPSGPLKRPQGRNVKLLFASEPEWVSDRDHLRLLDDFLKSHDIPFILKIQATGCATQHEIGHIYFPNRHFGGYFFKFVFKIVYKKNNNLLPSFS